MDFDKIDKNEIFLLVGEDLDKINSTTLKTKIFYQIQYFSVEDYKIINSPVGYKCSCDCLICWHILKVIYHKDKALTEPGNIDDF